MKDEGRKHDKISFHNRQKFVMCFMYVRQEFLNCVQFMARERVRDREREMLHVFA